MKTVEQYIVYYDKKCSMGDMYDSIDARLKGGWRIKTFLERKGEVLVVFENPLETWN